VSWCRQDHVAILLKYTEGELALTFKSNQQSMVQELISDSAAL
jgi:hypothetical protein